MPNRGDAVAHGPQQLKACFTVDELPEGAITTDMACYGASVTLLAGSGLQQGLPLTS